MSATTKPTTLPTETTCPDCALPRMTNELITSRQKGHLYKERKTMLLLISERDVRV